MLVHRAGMVLPDSLDVAGARAALIEAMRALSGAGGQRELVPASATKLAAMDHARVVLALIPGTLAEDVRFPGAHSYADIPVPRTPGEFVERVEEIERILWWLCVGERRRRGDPAYRRVYGFFDVGERLTGRGLRLN
jgi:hypothetical protein